MRHFRSCVGVTLAVLLWFSFRLSWREEKALTDDGVHISGLNIIEDVQQEVNRLDDADQSRGGKPTGLSSETASPSSPKARTTAKPSKQIVAPRALPTPERASTLRPSLPAVVTANPVSSSEGRPQLWEPPSIERPEIYSAFDDWRWSFPLNQTNRTEYLESRYLPYEYAPKCAGMCCLGASGSGGGSVSPSPVCFEHMDLQAEYVPTRSQRPVYSIVDVIRLWRRQNGLDRPLKIMLIGDSVTGQYFSALMCEALRNEAVARVLHRSERRELWSDRTFGWADVFGLRESTIWLHGDVPDHNTTVVYVKNYRIRQVTDTLRIVFQEFNIILFGWGLHYHSYDRNTYRKHLEPVLGAIRQLNATNETLLLWLGAPKQHFRYTNDSTNVDGSHRSVKKGSLQFCGPTMQVPFNHELFDIRGNVVAEEIRLANWTAKWMNLTEFEADCERVKGELLAGLTIHMLPNFEWTAPFYRNHWSYSPNTTLPQHDCTHSCWAPNFYEPVWDAMYVILNARTCERDPPQRYSTREWSQEFIDLSRRKGQRLIEETVQVHEYSTINRIYNALEASINKTIN